MAKMKTLTPGDAFFLLIESDKTPSQIGVLARMKLPEGKDKRFILDLVEGFRKYQPTASPFNLRLANRSLTNPAHTWEEVESIDIDYHLRHSALPQPGGERELAILISRLHSIPMDHSRPMWECHIIEGLEDNCFAIYSKMHHALIDGVAGARLMAHWLGQTEPEVVEDFRPFWAMTKPKRTKKSEELAPRPLSFSERWIAPLTIPFKSTAGVFEATLKSAIGARLTKSPELVAPYSAPNSILNTAIGPQRRVSTVEFKTSRLLDIGKQHGGTLNDVVMAVCGGALRSYLGELNALPEKSLVSQVPVSFRQKDDLGGGNAIGMVLASLGTDEPDTLARFNKVKASMSASKDLLSDMSATQITAYSALMTLPFALGQMTGVGNRSSRPMYNVVISNVPGPREKRYLNGAEVFSVHPISFVMQGQALNITLFTYDDKITFVFTACREALPNVQRLVTHTSEALEALEETLPQIVSKTSSTAKKKPVSKAHPATKARRKTSTRKPAGKASS